MMKRLLLALLVTYPLLADSLQLQEGFVAAHTEMLMDSTIDPLNNNLHADMRMDADDLTSLRGKLWIEMNLLSSDKADRDKNMYEATNVQKFPLATYTVSNVTKIDKDSYTINGNMNFYGQARALSFKAEIIEKDGLITISATSKFLVSDYGMEMPCIMFLCVRDEVDIYAKAVLRKE